MDGRRRKSRVERLKFWIPALLWLPGGNVAVEALRTGPAAWVTAPLPVVELLLPAPCGVPLALGVASAAGLLGQVAVGFQAILVCLPAWVVAWWLTRPPCRPRYDPWRLGPERKRSRGPFRFGR